MHVDGANVTVNHGASGSSIPKCSSDNKRIMTWRGDMWLVEPKFAEQAPAVVTSPMPVRFPACLLASTTEDEPEKEPSEWLLGLVIHSYVQSDRRELMYAILLDDGREVHLPSGEVDRINIVNHCDSIENKDAHDEGSDCAIAGGHPSSMDGEEGSQASYSSFFSTLLRSSTGGDLSTQEEFDLSLTPASPVWDAPEGYNIRLPQATTCQTQLQLPHIDSVTPDFHNVREEVPQPGFAEPAVLETRKTSSSMCGGTSDRKLRSHNNTGRQQSVHEESTKPRRRSNPDTANPMQPGSSSQQDPAAVPPLTAAHRPARNGRMSAAAERLAFLEAFAEDKWTTSRASFTVPPARFSGPVGGPTFPILRQPTKSSLFARFWSEHTLHKICVDTNRYASEVEDGSTVPLGGPNWWRLDKVELKAFVAVNMLMGIKRLPNHRSYWTRSNQFLYCPSISSIMTSRRYEDITRCLHVVDDTVAAVNDDDNEFDRLRKMRWLLRELQQRFKSN